MSWKTTYHIVIVAALLTFVSIDRGDAALLKRVVQRFIFQSATLDYQNPAYMDTGGFFRVARKNRKSLPSIYALFPFKVGLPSPVNLTYVAFQKIDNKWKESFINGYLDLCNVLSSKFKFYRMMFNFSNLPHSCPVFKGNYTINDCKFDSSDDKMPIVPANEWRVRSSWLHGKTTIMTYTFDCKIEHSSR